uniref:Thiolase N-terminal domain-containing protein n=1 Tax=Arcella intermedia TaxID=1963864 RepID=A0A6B2L6S5_9EUKA
MKDIPPNELAAISSKATLQATGVDPKLIDHVIYANVIPSTPDTLYGARHVGLKVGTKIETPAYSVNRLCGSGIQAMADAKSMIERGDAECVLVAGVENMSMVPHLTYGTRFGARLEPFTVVDFLMTSLADAYCQTPMAITAENLATKFNITRAEVDQFAYDSHKKALAGAGFLKENIVEVPVKKGTVKADEHTKADISLEEMAKLRPAFKKDGVVTAANASGIVDGAASLLVCSEAFVKANNVTPMASLGDSAVVGVEPKEMGIGPVPAIQKLLKRTGLQLSDIDFIEVNEAFAAQTLAVIKDLKADPAKVNVWGGAVAVGHPLGASGVRISINIAQQLKQYKKKQGIATACIGGGQGIAILIKAI